MKAFSLFVLFLFFGLVRSQENYPLSENLTNEDYEVLNAFFSQFNSYYYIDTIIPQKKYHSNFEGLFKANLKLYENANNFCNKGSNTEKLKFYCPLADAFKKYENLFVENDFIYLKNHYEEKGVEANIKLSKIINPQLINLSKEYYLKLNNENNSKRNTSVNRFTYSTLKILAIYYAQDKQIAIIVFQNNMPETSGDLNHHIIKKQNNIWWKSLGTLQRL